MQWHGPSLSRRDYIKAAGGLLLASTVTGGCSSNPDESYESIAAQTWRHGADHTTNSMSMLRELVRYATLAPNSHNAQPWRFRIAPGRIAILPDFTRRCPAVDPDDHHLYASLGCAAENIVLAARHYGLAAQVSLVGNAVQIELESGPQESSPLFRAIPDRQCTRTEYYGRRVPNDQLQTLEVISRDETVSNRLLTRPEALAEIVDYVVAGNSAQMADDAFMKELREWIRFSERSAVSHRDGLFSASSGNPSVPADWIGGALFRLFFKADAENDKYRRQIRSSAGVMAFFTEQNDQTSWVQVGRCYQRFALQATALGLRHAHINQAVEVPTVRAQFAQYLGIGDRRPDLLIRFGYGPQLPRSLRRPVDEVLDIVS